MDKNIVNHVDLQKLTKSNHLLTTNLINTKVNNVLAFVSSKPSILDKNILEERKKKSDENIETIEKKRLKLLNYPTKSSLDTLIKVDLNSPVLTKPKILLNDQIVKRKYESYANTNSHASIGNKTSLLTIKNNYLDNCFVKDKGIINDNININIKNEKEITEEPTNLEKQLNIRYIFDDLTNSQSYLDLIKSINQNESFDKKTEEIEEKNFKFFGYQSPKYTLKRDSDLVKLKNVLLNIVSTSLLRSPNFKDPQDQTRLDIIDITNRILLVDGEFILKLALYTRKELNVRTTANFLISLASFNEKSRKYLQRYFSTTVVLPSDWIDVAEQYQSFNDKRIRFGALPSALRKSMVEKFCDFDEYQLAKYNKDKSKRKTTGKLKNIKHIKAQLKFDEKGNKIENLDNESIYEDKYLMSCKNGLKINEIVDLELLINEKCKTLKIDLVAKIMQNSENNISKRYINKERRNELHNIKDEKIDETVPLRFTIDFMYSRTTVKSFVNKAWTKPIVKMNSVSPLLNINNESSKIKIKIFISSSEFNIKVNDVVLMKYEHIKHGIELEKINFIRISGIDIKLEKLSIESSDEIVEDEVENEEEISKKTFTLKQLIRQLHISKPTQHVFGLLGKKYPSTYEEFLASGLPGVFESQKVNKRMRLAIPETWETQISMKGNKACVWEQLIDNKKLPYMAMLRNLRNMIKAGIDEKHHQWVLKKLQDEGSVINSKQFPINFFSAYDVIDELQKDLEQNETSLNQNNQNKFLKYKEKKFKKNSKQLKDMMYDRDILIRYKKSIDNALKVATTYNISPIKGRTIIFVESNSSMEYECKTARVGKSKRSVSEIAALLGLMFKYSCEESRLLVYNGECTEIELQEGTILDNMKIMKEMEMIRKKKISLEKILRDLISKRILVDNLIFIFQNLTDNSDLVLFLKQFLSKYRVCVNENLLFVNIDLGAVQTCVTYENQYFNHENDVIISGYSDSILKFVAEKGNQGQLVHIENIDKSYELPILKKSILNNEDDKKIDIGFNVEKPMKIITSSPNWINTKVFVSSTFRDMHSERDILSRIVFPLLKSKLNQRFINVSEVDLRWGITETEALQNKTIDICLRQVLECDFFIGILGERYGHIPMINEVKKIPQLNWLNSYKKEASITELEIQCAAFEKFTNDHKKALERTFFYFRDNSFIKDVPEKFKFNFVSEDVNSEQEVKKLKKKIISNGFEVFKDYKCEWFGVDKEKRALLSNLDKFAQRVYDNLLNAISTTFSINNFNDLDEYAHTSGLHNLFIKKCAEKFVSRQKLFISFEKLIKDQMFSYNFKENFAHVLLVEGDPGAGKTTFLCHFINNLHDSTHLFSHFVNACPGSESLIALLKRFNIEIIKKYNLKIDVNIVKETNDIKLLKNQLINIFDDLNNLINDKFLIVIDGVDQLIDSNGYLDESLNWMPEKIPSKFTIILSARKTSRIQHILNNRFQNINTKESLKIQYDIFLIPGLDIVEKKELVRQNLSLYNKRLDEALFNNQMKYITAKKDASNPLYLVIACEELRFHNNFETLNDKLKEIPQKLPALIPYVISRLEFDYGASYVAFAFQILLNSKEGLKDYELKEMLNFCIFIENDMLLNIFEKIDSILEIKKYTDISKLNLAIYTFNKDAKFLSFIESISETFLRPFSSSNSSNLRIKTHSVIENCLKVKFSKSNNINEKINKLMATYYWLQLDKHLEFKWCTKNTRAYSYLIYHLCQCSCFNDVLNILCDLSFLAGKSMLGLSSQLLEEFEFYGVTKVKTFFTKIKNSNPILVKFNEYKSFFIENFHIILRNPVLIFQQAMNQPRNSAPLESLKSILEDKRVTYMFEETNKDSLVNEFLTKSTSLTIKQFNSTVSRVSLAPNEQYFACGTDDCEIKLFSLSTGIIVKKFNGHSGKINDLCFIGNDTLCSTSSDGLVSLWNVSGGYRIKILNHHNGHVVSSCSADPRGKFLVTVGFDCTIKIWGTNDWSLSGEIRGHGRPINCVAYHPDGDIIGTGCWDSCIRLFNVFDRQRIAVFRGQLGSVRSLSFSKNGVFIASGSMDGNVYLWNTKTGSKVGVYKGHSLSVNCLSFCQNSDTLITGSSDRKIKIWPATPGKCIKIIKEKLPITSVCINQKTGKSIGIGFQNGELKIYNLNEFTELNCKPHNAFIKRMKYNFDSRFLISGAEDGTVKITSVLEKKLEITAELIGHCGTINSIAVSNLDIIITGCEDSSVRIFDPEFDELEYNSKLKPFLTLNQHTSPVTACSFNSQGTKFVTTSKDATVIVWKYEIYQKKVTEEFRINSAHPDWITDCKWSLSSDYILTASNDFTLKVFDAKTGNHKTTMIGHTSSINTCAFQYGCAVSTSSDGSIKVWSHKGHEITTLFGHQMRVNGCDLFVKVKVLNNETTNENVDEIIAQQFDWAECVEEEERKKIIEATKIHKTTHIEKVMVVTVSDDCSLRIWLPMESNNILSLEDHNERIESIAIGSNNMMCSASADETVKVRNLYNFFSNYKSGKIINSEELKGHNFEITNILSDINNKMVFSTSSDGNLMIWKCQYKENKLISLKFLKQFEIHDDYVNSFCIIKESENIIEFATCSNDKRIKIWNLDFSDYNLLSLILINCLYLKDPSVNLLTFKRDKSVKKLSNILISLEYKNTDTWISIYDINDNYSRSKNSGCCIKGLSSFYYEAKVIESFIYLTIINDGILKIEIDDIISGFKNYHKHNQNTLEKITHRESNASLWYTTLTNADENYIIAGDCEGNINKCLNGTNLMEKFKKIHDSHITSIVNVNFSNFTRLVTASKDGSVKIWSSNGAQQLGQYNFNSGIVNVIILKNDLKNGLLNLICADEAGGIHVLIWYDKI